MEYLVAPEPTTQATTNNRQNHVIVCTHAPTHLQSFLPFLPWDTPDDNEAQIPQAAIASVMWAAFRIEDDSDVCDEDLVVSLLQPSTLMTAVLKLLEQGFNFTIEATSWADARQRLKHHVSSKDDGVFSLTQADINDIEPGTANAGPAKTRHIKNLTLGEMREELSNSTAPICTFEVFASPREVLTQRYDADLPFMRLVESIDNNHKIHDSNMLSMAA